MSLQIHQIPVGGLDKNFSYLIADAASHQAYVVDPSGDLDAILEVVEHHQLTISGVLITHTHHDHIDQLAELLRAYAVPVYVQTLGTSAIVSPGQIIGVNDGDTILLGEAKITVLHTPGHIEDAVCFYIQSTDAADGVPKLISGDTLFVEGCGRSSETQVKDLYESLQELKTLPGETKVYPGHDYGSRPHSTISYELEHNPYLLAKNFTEFKERRL